MKSHIKFEQVRGCEYCTAAKRELYKRLAEGKAVTITLRPEHPGSPAMGWHIDLPKD